MITATVKRSRVIPVERGALGLRRGSYPVASKLLLALRPYAFGEDVLIDDLSGNTGEDVVTSWRGRTGEDVLIAGYMIPEEYQASMFAILGEGLWFDANGIAKQVNTVELANSDEINQFAVWYRLDAAAGTGKREVLFYDPDTLLYSEYVVIATWMKESTDDFPSALFNGMDFRLATYTGGPTYVPDNLGVLRSPGSNLPAVQGMRLATTVIDGAVLGPELAVNGGFDSDTVWGKGLGWIISNGVATHTGTTSSNLTLTGVFGVGKAYLISGLLGNSFSVYCGSGTVLLNQYGAVNLTMVCSGSTDFYIRTATNNVTADNISIREVIPTYVSTDASGDPIVASTPQKTVTYNTDWTTKSFAETFDKFDISDPLKAPGWLCEPVRTNKVTCRKSDPVDTSGLTKGGDAAAILSVVDDTAALTAAGLIGICNSGKVYKLDNSLGVLSSVVDFSGATGNTNNHSIKIIAKTNGTECKIRTNFAEGIVSFTNTTYAVIKSENIVIGGTGRLFTLQASAGAIVYFILPDLQEGSFCTSSICKASDGSDPLTALTRSATVASFPTAGKIPVNNFAIRMIVVPRASGQNGTFLFGTFVGSTSYSFSYYIQSSNITFRKTVNSVATTVTAPITHTTGVPLEIIYVSSATVGMQTSVRAFSTTWNAFTDGTLNSTDAAKANAQIGSAYQLGALNSTSQFTGNISLFDCIPIPSGITDPMAWAKTHWGVA